VGRTHRSKVVACKSSPTETPKFPAYPYKYQGLFAKKAFAPPESKLKFSLGLTIHRQVRKDTYTPIRVRVQSVKWKTSNGSR